MAEQQLDNQFITKSNRKVKMRDFDKYEYLMEYNRKLYLLRHSYKDENRKIHDINNFSIKQKGAIVNEIWRVQKKLKELTDKLNIDMPEKYKN